MDPNATLNELRETAQYVKQLTYDGSIEIGTDEMERFLGEMVDHFQMLDEWLTRGGYLPAAWERR